MDAPEFWPSSSSSELAFPAASSSSFHCYLRKAIRAVLLRPSKVDFFFLVLAKGLADLVVDVVAGAFAVS